MTGFRGELRVIPRATWAMVAAVWLVFPAVVWFVAPPQDRFTMPGIVATVLAPFFLSIYVMLIGYVNGDARRRGMRYVLWTLLAIFIPNAIGIILYFILRDPLSRPCPKCGASVRGGFAFCQACGTALTHTCPACRHSVEPDWSHCPHCGTGLRAA